MRRARTMVGLAVAALVMTGCGGGADTAGEGSATDSAATGDAAPTAGETSAQAEDGGGGEAPVELEGQVNVHGSGSVSGGALQLEADDFYFEPTFVQAPAGETISVTVVNEGEAPHTFTIDAQGIDEELDPGQEVTVEVTAPDGAVLFYCRFHAGQGMQGAIYSEAGATVGGTSTGTSGGSDDSGARDPYDY